MAELVKVNSTNIEDLCDLIKSCYVESYSGFLEKEILDYILKFLNKDSLKDEVKSKENKFYFIKNDSKNIGFIKFQESEIKVKLCDFYFLNNKLFEKFSSAVLNKLLNLLNKPVETFVCDRHIEKINFFLKEGFKKKEKAALYLGSSIYLHGFLLADF